PAGGPRGRAAGGVGGRRAWRLFGDCGRGECRPDNIVAGAEVGACGQSGRPRVGEARPSARTGLRLRGVTSRFTLNLNSGPAVAAAWQRFQDEEFPIVITDWMMPGVDGLELIRRIRAHPRPGYVYAILLTALSQKADLVQGMEAGADDFLSKPFDREELRVRL